MEQQNQVDGFKNGYFVRKKHKSKSAFPQFLICVHECCEVVQFVSAKSGNVEFELCISEAMHMANILLTASSTKDKDLVIGNSDRLTGFYAVRTCRRNCKNDRFLICKDNCDEIIQLFSTVSREIEFEMCDSTAKQMASEIVSVVLEKSKTNHSSLHIL